MFEGGTGDDIYKKAEGKINKMFFKDFEEGQELFQRAGAAYKIEKNWGRAGESFSRAGDCSVKNKSEHEACQNYTESAKCYKKVDLSKAETNIQIAVQMNIESNKLGQAARLLKEYAEALIEDGQPAAAIPHFQKAHDWFLAEEQTSSAQQCMVKMVHIYGELDEWDKCRDLCEKVGKSYCRGALKHQAKDFFVKALLCRVVQIKEDNKIDATAECRDAFESYLCIDINLKHTREHEFCEALLDSVDEGDIEKFEEAVQLLDELRLLDDWKTHVLVQIKRNFEDVR